MTDKEQFAELNIEQIRRDFPVLTRTVGNGNPLVYLDNAATSQTPVQVIAEITRFYRDHNANIHRGVHTLSVESTELYEGARNTIAEFLGAPSASECIFTRNTTESINLVASAWGKSNLEEGDEIVISEIEHHSNIVPWQIIRDELNVSLRFIPMLTDGSLDVDAAAEIIGPRTKLVAITAMANSLGNITPLADIIEMAKKHDALVLVDGAQSAPHMLVSYTHLTLPTNREV